MQNDTLFMNWGYYEQTKKSKLPAWQFPQWQEVWKFLHFICTRFTIVKLPQHDTTKSLQHIIFGRSKMLHCNTLSFDKSVNVLANTQKNGQYFHQPMSPDQHMEPYGRGTHHEEHFAIVLVLWAHGYTSVPVNWPCVVAKLHCFNDPSHHNESEHYPCWVQEN